MGCFHFSSCTIEVLLFYLMKMELEIIHERKSDTTEEKTDQECASKPESISISSYGIEIDRKKIKSVPVNEQSEVLQDLGVSAYEQEEFEEGVLQQVDDAIEEREWRVAIKSAEKNVQQIKDEVR